MGWDVTSVLETLNKVVSGVAARTLLTEKTFPLDEDVDYIWSKYLKELVDLVTKDFAFYARKGAFIYKSITSDELPSDAAKEASKINRVVINIGVGLGNNYNVALKRIQVSINLSAIGAMGNYDELPAGQKKRIHSEFDPSALKASISHEISHWLSDSLHNRHLAKTIVKFPLGFNINAHHIEVDAQIHALKELKRINQDKWDDMTMIDIYRIKPSFHVVHREQSSKGEFAKWSRAFYSRAAREGLLGKKMKPVPEYGEGD